MELRNLDSKGFFVVERPLLSSYDFNALRSYLRSLNITFKVFRKISVGMMLDSYLDYKRGTEILVVPFDEKFLNWEDYLVTLSSPKLNLRLRELITNGKNVALE